MTWPGANDQIQPIPGSSRAKSLDHPRHCPRQHLFRGFLIRSNPIQQAGCVFGLNEGVALGGASAIHDTFQFSKVILNHGEGLVRLEVEIDNTSFGLGGGDSHQLRGGRDGLDRQGWHEERKKRDG